MINEFWKLYCLNNDLFNNYVNCYNYNNFGVKLGINSPRYHLEKIRSLYTSMLKVSNAIKTSHATFWTGYHKEYAYVNEKIYKELLKLDMDNFTGNKLGRFKIKVFDSSHDFIIIYNETDARCERIEVVGLP